MTPFAFLLVLLAGLGLIALVGLLWDYHSRGRRKKVFRDTYR